MLFVYILGVVLVIFLYFEEWRYNFLINSSWKKRKQVEPTFENARRQCKFHVVHSFKYHFWAWPPFTDIFQVLHVIWIRDKIQMSTLNTNMTTPKTLWLLCKDKPTILWAQLCLQAHLRAPTGCGCAPCVLGKVDNVSLFRNKIVYLPRMSIHMEGPGLVNMIFSIT